VKFVLHNPIHKSNSGGVCLCGQCLEDSSSHCPFPVVSVCGDKQGKAGRPGQPLRGARRGAISIKEILGENRGTYI